ncbi:KxDL motif-containing protein 1 [Zea mays]|uniref:KxDL motif-containing protein 1 n=2 Tax=Zea mays TaxID=4577 RepID=A0A8J8YGN8_MAIZE|nr:KxDL motif CG10681-like protein [Zea mays]PWZ22198.1 KxDL motif-containing protein 1 [Zea mays]
MKYLPPAPDNGIGVNVRIGEVNLLEGSSLAAPDNEELAAGMGRLQDSNAVLTHFNEYSERCFVEVSGDFASKTRLLKSMKADLDHIFTKLREMKARLAATYPDAFPNGAMSKTMDQRPDLESPLD